MRRLFVAILIALWPTTGMADGGPGNASILVTFGNLPGVWQLYGNTTIPIAINVVTGQVIQVSPANFAPGLYPNGTTLLLVPTTITPFVPAPPAPIHINLWNPGDTAPAGNPGPSGGSGPVSAPSTPRDYDPTDNPHS